jgi:hypothetical protein
LDQVRDAISLKRYSYRIEQANVDLLSGTLPLGCLQHVIPQHQLLGVGVQIHLLLQPLRRRVAVVVNPSYKTGLNRQNLAGNELTPTTRFRIWRSSD